jgi:hypothetical protein
MSPDSLPFVNLFLQAMKTDASRAEIRFLDPAGGAKETI